MRGGRGATAALVSMVAVAAVAMGLVLFASESRTPPAPDEPLSQRAIGQPVEQADYRWGRLTVYPVIDDGTLYPVPTGEPAEIWAAFTRIVTPEVAADQMLALRVAYAPSSDAIAAVERMSAAPARWTLTVNFAYEVARPAYLRVLVHEYAHLLTLGDDDLDPTFGDCGTTQLQEGCLLEDSTLQRFQASFWAGYGSAAPPPDSESPADGWRLFVEHTADFVTSYAAMNVVEDAAETFAEFVIRDRPSPASGLWARKILFFWDDPTYVAIREHIRSWYADELPAFEPPSR